MKSEDQEGRTVYHDDIRRWTSQEILRVQSGLKYFIITWSQAESAVVLKEVDRITIPYFPGDEYKSDLNKYVNSGKSAALQQQIEDKYKTYNLAYNKAGMRLMVNKPPLSYQHKTFPSLYYSSKCLVQTGWEEFVTKLIELIYS
jgi:hypothetical protein